MKANHKTQSFTSPRAASLLLLLSAMAFTGCKAIQKAEFIPGPEQIHKHPVRIALVLPKDFCAYEQHRDPEGYVYPLGLYLCPCARHVARQAFDKVTEFDSLDAALQCQEADAILIPKLVKFEIRARGVAWEDRHTLAVLEWTLKNFKDQKTLWLATVEGRAQGKVGTMLTMDKNDRIATQQAMDDMYRKSIEAFNNSGEIMVFSKSLTQR